MRIKPEVEKTRKELCSLEITDDGVAYARVYYPNGEASRPVLKECEFCVYPTNVPDQLQACLNNLVTKYNLEGVACNLVLSPQNYRVILVNVPNVLPEEYRIAVRWQIKDLIDYPIEDTTLDIFIPSAFSQIEPPKLYVTAARTSFVHKISGNARAALFNLMAVDIREFAIRNLLAPLLIPEKSAVFLSSDQNECLLVIVKNNQLRFVRNIPLKLTVASTRVDFKRLSDEVQRSLDYYSNELKQDAPEALFLPPTAKVNDELIETIVKNVYLKVNPLLLEKIVATEYGQLLTPELQAACYVAIGGALRKFEEQEWNKT